MRKRRPLAFLTGKKRSESGSIVLEASLVLPIVLMAIIFFICLIRLNAAQMALHGVVSQAVRQAAANIHPIDLAVSGTAGDEEQAGNGNGDTPPIPENGSSTSAVTGDGAFMAVDERTLPEEQILARTASEEPLPAVRFLADKLEEWLPSPSGALLAAVLKGDWKSIQDTAVATVGRPIIEPMLRHEADTSILDPDRIRLSKLSLPDLKNKSDLFLTIEAEYSYRLGFPFTKKYIVLRERAMERVWTPDPLPAIRGGNGAEDELGPIQIVLIEPVPVRPGNKAHVVVKTNPGRSLSIQVLYKSGRSVAKNLEDKVTDSDGMAEWTWLVSGNTTPGIWEVVVTASDGVKAARHFTIQRKHEGTDRVNG